MVKKKTPRFFFAPVNYFSVVVKTTELNGAVKIPFDGDISTGLFGVLDSVVIFDV